MSGQVSGTRKVLLEIRDEQRRTNERISALQERIGRFEERVVGELHGISAVLVEVRDLASRLV